MATPSSNPLRPRRADPARQPSSSSSEMIGNFKRLEHIGKGSFAEVYRGIHVVRSPSFISSLSARRVEHLSADAPSLDTKSNANHIRYAGKASIRGHQIRQHEQAEQETQRQPRVRDLHLA